MIRMISPVGVGRQHRVPGPGELFGWYSRYNWFLCQLFFPYLHSYTLIIFWSGKEENDVWLEDIQFARQQIQVLDYKTILLVGNRPRYIKAIFAYVAGDKPQPI